MHLQPLHLVSTVSLEILCGRRAFTYYSFIFMRFRAKGEGQRTRSKVTNRPTRRRSYNPREAPEVLWEAVLLPGMVPKVELPR
jgi:hypothetical protein